VAVKLIPGKTNLIGYNDLDGKPITMDSFDTANLRPPWISMDDTSAWVISDDKRVVGELDWSIGRTESGMDEMLAQSDCDFDKDDMHLNWINMYDKGKGYASSSLKQKHKDWKDKGYKSVTLQPSTSGAGASDGAVGKFGKSRFAKRSSGLTTGQAGQKKLYSWYNDLGYKKSNLCAHDDECDDLFNCILTKYL